MNAPVSPSHKERINAPGIRGYVRDHTIDEAFFSTNSNNNIINEFKKLTGYEEIFDFSSYKDNVMHHPFSQDRGGHTVKTEVVDRYLMQALDVLANAVQEVRVDHALSALGEVAPRPPARR